MATHRHYCWYDKVFACLNDGLNALSHPGTRENPSAPIKETKLTPQEQRHSAGLMRVNHCGEVAAQALYLGQSAVTVDRALRETLIQAGIEEKDHLNWCQARLKELGSHTSFLNPIWFSGALAMGLAAGLLGRGWNLGFLAETEHQVYQHLESHLNKLPAHDLKSRAIVLQMQEDEQKHEHTAIEHGAKELPNGVKTAMRLTASIMTAVAYYV